ncbi:hypothetical protein KSP40_PGU003836 [Platanthera guangdongensis]|uniref:Uncharacterized protein n=1 Tax=Platanthera guangdongensis TaxID=2320717 RepID=A0ABR2LGP1_9ASPA
MKVVSGIHCQLNMILPGSWRDLEVGLQTSRARVVLIKNSGLELELDEPVINRLEIELDELDKLDD